MLKHFSIALFIGLASAPFAASAKDVEAASGYALLQPVSNSSPSQQIELDDAAKARIQAALQALVPEYNRRARRDGEASANDWIRQKAFELGQREADIMKQRLGRQ